MGIGASMVENFSKQGSQVVFLDIAEEQAHALITKIKDQGTTHVPVFHRCDVADIEGSLKPTAAKILEQFPKVDALINSAAGITFKTGATMDLTPEQWNHSLNVNLNHHFFLTQALMPGLLAATSTAAIVNMGSISWAIPATGIAPYTASKAAIMGLTRTLAHELGPKGIRVNSIMPGSIATEREIREVLTPEYEAKVLGSQAIKRLLVPAEVARTAMWLVSDDSSGMTNQSIRVDGGWT